jgi:hypothetical protein
MQSFGRAYVLHKEVFQLPQRLLQQDPQEPFLLSCAFLAVACTVFFRRNG